MTSSLALIRQLVFIGRAALLLHLGRYDSAESFCRSAVKKSGTHPVHHEWLAKTLWKQGRLDEAVQEYRVAIALRKTTLSMDRIDLIRILLGAHQYNEAIIECQKLLSPTSHKVSGMFRKMHEHVAYDSLYQAYVGLGDYQRAKDALVKLLPLLSHRGRAQALRNIAVCEQYIKNS